MVNKPTLPRITDLWMEQNGYSDGITKWFEYKLLLSKFCLIFFFLFKINHSMTNFMEYIITESNKTIA